MFYFAKNFLINIVSLIIISGISYTVNAATILSNPASRWDGNTVPYKLDPSVNEYIKKNIKSAIRHIENNSAVRFVDITSGNQSTNSWVRFITFNNGCYATPGMPASGEAIVNLDANQPGCQTVRTIIHELMHSLGFFHEQQRPDRDSFISFHPENICGGECTPPGNPWEKLSSSVVDTTYEYDFNSITHYERSQFSVSGSTFVIESIVPGKKVDPGHRLSNIDKQALDQFYAPTKLIARFQTDQIISFVHNPVLLDASSSFDPSNPNAALDHNLGFLLPTGPVSISLDSSQPSTSHIFDETGTYIVELIVSDHAGIESDRVEQELIVYGAETMAAIYPVW